MGRNHEESGRGVARHQKTMTIRWAGRFHLSLLSALCLIPAAAQAQGLVRADFQDVAADYEHFGGVYPEPIDMFLCDGAFFDYVDTEDDSSSCDPDPLLNGVLQSDVSGGGRWKFGTGSSNGWPLVGFNFSAAEAGADCAALAAVGLGNGPSGQTCGCTENTADNVSPNCSLPIDISADRVFKRGATRQTLKRFYIWDWDRTGPQAGIDYLDPLYLCEDTLGHPGDPNWRYLQTSPCGTTDSCLGLGSPATTSGLAEVFDSSDSTALGNWCLPMKILLQRVPYPSDDGGGGGGNACELSPKGDACDGNTDCCSNKCRGPAGNKTCK